jgi:hypothetical protein
MKTKWIKQEIAGKTLEWGDVSPYKMTPKRSKTWCEEQGGRLPTVVELLTAYEQKVKGFKDKTYWSSTPHLPTLYPNSAMCVFFSSGYLSYSNKNYSLHVRCVRDVK